MKFKFILNSKSFEWERFITGTEIRQVGNISNYDILFLNTEGRDDEVHDTEKIDLARTEIEAFYTLPRNPVHKITINKAPYEWKQRYITGDEIRKLGHILQNQLVYLKIQGDDEKIENNERVDLARRGVENFYSTETPVEIIIIVNGRQKSWTEKTISFEEVIVLAFDNYDNNPNIVYSVTYDKGPHQNIEGTMVKGDIVCVKNKMVFNATATDKS